MLKNMMHHVTKDTLAGEGPVVLFKLDGFVDALREWVDVDGIFDGMEDGVAAGQARLPHSRAAVPLAVGRARALREAIHSKHFRKEAILSSVCAIQPERRHRHRPSQNKCRMIEHHAVHDGRRVSPAVSCVSDPYLFNLAATLVRPVQVPVEEERPSVLEEPQQLSAAFEHARQVPSFDVHRLAHYLERPLHVVKASMF